MRQVRTEQKRKDRFSSGKIRVLVVDDSALIRRLFATLLKEESDMELMASVPDPFRAVEELRKELPDVMILDLEMPGMDGLTFLRKIMTQRPIPVIICSSLVTDSSDSFFRSFRYGAVEVIAKPSRSTPEAFEELRIEVTDAIRATARARMDRLGLLDLERNRKFSADVVIPESENRALKETTDKFIALGASTGGTEAIARILQDLPADVRGMVIVQHMPEHFTRLFAERLQSLCRVDVREAKDGDSIRNGSVLIAPGNRHMVVERDGAHYRVRILDAPMVNRHRPSVDVLFRSVAQSAGLNSTGILLTGMGDDGARGLLEMKKSGSVTIVQDEETSVVFGMPGEAISLGAAGSVMPLEQIAGEICRISGISGF